MAWGYETREQREAAQVIEHATGCLCLDCGRHGLPPGVCRACDGPTIRLVVLAEGQTA